MREGQLVVRRREGVEREQEQEQDTRYDMKLMHRADL